MIQILSIFTAIVVLTNMTQASSFKDAFEAHKRDASAHCIPVVQQDGSSSETISSFKWNSPKQPVDLESFLSSGPSRLYVEPISFNLGDMLTQAAKPKSTKKKISKSGVGSFVNMHYPQAQPLTVQSHFDVQNADTIISEPQTKKRKSDQLSILKFITVEKKKSSHTSDSEGSTDRESLPRSNSVTSSLPSTSDSAGSDISSDEDNAL